MYSTLEHEASRHEQNPSAVRARETEPMLFRRRQITLLPAEPSKAAPHRFAVPTIGARSSAINKPFESRDHVTVCVTKGRFISVGVFRSGKVAVEQL